MTDKILIGDPTIRMHSPLRCVEIERIKQDVKWGEQNHNDLKWFAILDEEALVARRCAYWCSLRGAPESTNKTTHTVHVHRCNVFTPDTLRVLMIRASHQEEISYEAI